MDDEKYFCDKELGAIWTEEKCIFRVWSPKAQKVTVNLYYDCTADEPFFIRELKCQNGLWQCEVAVDLNGVYYTYSVTTDDIEKETIDIYAKSAGVNGRRGMIFDDSLTDPDGWENVSYLKCKSKADAVIYELHVRDLSADGSASFSERGKFNAFGEKNVKNEFGDTVGLDYIASLGVTHIQLLPVYDFATVDESSEEPNYNWGYDPLNYNFPEGSYSSDAYDGFVRVREFKQLVMEAHSRGIGVIMDVVYNHIYEAENSPFNIICPNYYYRHFDGKLSNGSGCGNEFASERPMARKFICDSLCFLLKEYKLDGFRFDLMGLIDIDTLNFCAKKLKEINPDVLLYGEGWTADISPLDENKRGIKKNAVSLPDFSMFSDDFRDCVKGSVFDDADCGYINGNAKEKSEMMKAVLTGGVSFPLYDDIYEHWTDSPLQSINYVEAHDNLTFYDKLKVSMKNSDDEKIKAVDKLGAALVFLAQGMPFIQAGQEFLRSKPSPDGNGFVHDSYDSPDSVNSLKWNDVTKNRDVVEYYRGLMAFRKRFDTFRMRSADEIRKRIRFADIENGAFCEYADDFVIVIDPLEKEVSVSLDGEYDVYADCERAGEKVLYRVSGEVKVRAMSVMVMKRVE